MIELTMVADNYPHILPLKDGRISSKLVKLNFVEYKRVADAFDTQVENQTYDVCEIAAATFFQALDFKKPLRLLPFVCLGSFHHRSVWYDPDLGVVTPEDLRGARVAVKAYTQTTGVWCRGALEEQFNIKPEEITWVTTEAPHASEYVSPPNVIRAAEGLKPIDLVRNGDCIAVVLLPKLAEGTNLKSVVPNVPEAEKVWYERHRAVPINHMLCIKNEVLEQHPEAAREIYHMLEESYKIALNAGELTPAIRIGSENMWHTLDVCMDYCVSQKLITRKFTREELFAPVED